MAKSQRTVARSFVWAFAFVATALAMPMPVVAAPSAERCRGVDMLQEMEKASPETYRSIRDAARQTPNDGAVLWRLERAGIEPSYLLGTIHMTDDRVTALSPTVTSAISSARVVALEVADVSPEAANAAMLRASRLVMFTDGRRLDGILSEREVEKVKTMLTAAGMPAEVSTMFKPWVVNMFLSVSACERRNVKLGMPVLDMKIADMARRLGKPVKGLETIEAQLGAMAAIPDDQQVGMLRASLQYADRADDSMETLLQLYLRREMGVAWPFQLALAEKAGVGAQSFSAFRQRILVDRNKRMHAAALPLLDQGGVLMAVGALHLVGEDGLVSLLKRSGYALTPVE